MVRMSHKNKDVQSFQYDILEKEHWNATRIYVLVLAATYQSMWI